MRPDPNFTNDGMRSVASWLAALLLAVGCGVSGGALAQGQMRETLGPQTEKSQPQDTATPDPEVAEENADQDEDAAQDSGERAADNAKATEDAAEVNRAQVQPDIVKEQQQRYETLRDTWMRRIVPDGLDGDSKAASLRDSGVSSVALEAHNIDFFFADHVGFHVKNLKAALEPVNPGEPVDFDDPNQYVIHILSGEVLVRPQDLDALFNNHLLTYQPRSLSSLESRMSKDTLTVDVGTRIFRFIPPVGGLPTTLSGPIHLTDDNKIVYTPTSVKQFGTVPLKPLLSGAGIPLSALTPFKRQGVVLDGDKLVMDPETVFPPPRFKIDRITDASLSDEGLTLSFDSEIGDSGYIDPPIASDSYIWLQSGDARFYSTLLVNAHLELLSENDEPLDFHLYHYRAQSADGTIKSLEDGSLIVRVPNEFEIDDTDLHQYSGLKPRTANAQ